MLLTQPDVVICTRLYHLINVKHPNVNTIGLQRHRHANVSRCNSCDSDFPKKNDSVTLEMKWDASEAVLIAEKFTMPFKPQMLSEQVIYLTAFLMCNASPPEILAIV